MPAPKWTHVFLKLNFQDKSKLPVNFLFYIPTYLRQKFSGLFWMVKPFYIQDYPENFRYNTKTRTITSDFIRTSIESSLTRWEKKTHIRQMWWVPGQLAFYKLLTWTRLENSNVGTKKNYMEAFNIFPCYMMKFLCLLFLLPALS